MRKLVELHKKIYLLNFTNWIPQESIHLLTKLPCVPQYRKEKMQAQMNEGKRKVIATILSKEKISFVYAKVFT